MGTDRKEPEVNDTKKALAALDVARRSDGTGEQVAAALGGPTPGIAMALTYAHEHGQHDDGRNPFCPSCTRV